MMHIMSYIRAHVVCSTGLTATMRFAPAHDGDVGGVMAVDYPLRVLSSFLQKTDIGKYTPDAGACVRV
jgi:hypothetical protein